mgnify:CR=1 FL=1
MKRRIAALIRRYGSSVQAVFPDRCVAPQGAADQRVDAVGPDEHVGLVGGAVGEVQRHRAAFLQPVTSRSWQNMDHMIPTGGEVPRGQFLYIGPPELDIRGAEHLYLAGRYFLVRRADMIVFDDAELFLWGLCVEGGREDPWSS